MSSKISQNLKFLVKKIIEDSKKNLLKLTKQYPEASTASPPKNELGFRKKTTPIIKR